MVGQLMSGRGRADFFARGDWNIACSMCGRKRKASMMVRNWQGLFRCPEHNEPRHPQDYAKGVKDVMTVPFAQPETDTFTAVCTLTGISSIPWFAMPGCFLPGAPLLATIDPLFGWCEGGLDGTIAEPDMAEPDCSVPGRPWEHF